MIYSHGVTGDIHGRAVMICSPLGLMICSHDVTDEIHGRAVMIYSPLGLMRIWRNNAKNGCGGGALRLFFAFYTTPGCKNG